MRIKIVVNAGNLALSMLLILGTQNAHALPLSTSNDIFVNIWAENAQTSYVADLGSLTNFYAETTGATSGQSFSIPLDTAFANWASTALAGGDTLMWNIAGVNLAAPTTTADAVLFSAQVGSYFYNSTNTGLSPNYLNFETLQGKVGTRIDNVNVTYGINNTEFASATDQSYFNASNWGKTEGQGGTAPNVSTTISSAGGTNQLGLEYIFTPGTSPLKNSTLMDYQLLPGYFTLNVANSSLDWVSTATTTVPAPGAIWLFLGGIIGVLKLQKRNLGISV